MCGRRGDKNVSLMQRDMSSVKLKCSCCSEEEKRRKEFVNPTGHLAVLKLFSASLTASASRSIPEPSSRLVTDSREFWEEEKKIFKINCVIKVSNESEV